MGFYGNITNVNRTQFSFDKIYPNRYEMDTKRLTDNVYLGRYVLVEYDSNYHLDTFLRVFFVGNVAYQYNEGLKTDSKYKITQGVVGYGDLVYTTESKLHPEQGLSGKDCQFYKCTSTLVNGSVNPATFEDITNLDGPFYTDNYLIDQSRYGKGRGYDSTVWQKVYSEGTEKYVMIAELNTVVPTFDVVADAPTTNPVVPHFDTQSTDVYYKLHMQTPWGFRVAAATDSDKSDGKTTWTTYDYDKDNGIHEEKTEEKDAAIYFNREGFKEYKNSSLEDLKDNYIKLSLASSGQAQYDDHNPATKDPIAANDIQELTINLPAIGNMMSDAWDIIHGPNRDNARTDENGSLQGRLDSFTEMNVNAIPVKRSLDGTLVGSYINGNTNKEVNNVLSEELSESFDSDDAWIKTSINTIGLDNTTDLSGIAIHHTFHAAPDTSTTANKNDATGNGENRGQGDTLKLYAPIVDKAGHVVGKNTETVTLPYGFKTISVANESESTDGVTAAAGDVVADNTQDTLTLTPGNKWIHITANGDNDTVTVSHEVNSITTTEVAGTDLTIDTSASVTIPDWTYDEGGHIRSKQNHLYKLPFGYGKIKGDSGSTAATATYDELTFTSDEWLTATVDKDKVIYSHDYPEKIDDTESKSNVNDNGDTIVLETLSRDEKGHVTKVNQNIVTLPYGYKTFTGDSGSSSADNTQDTMSITGDSWVQTKVSEDKIELSHIGPVAVTAVKVNDITPKFGETFDIIDWYYDEKGHKSSSNTHTVKIPLPSLTNGTGNVVTGLALNTAEGALTETKNNISNLLLTDYSKKTNNEDINSTDALGDALSKLQTQIHDTETVISNLDYTETADNTQIITQITQTDGKITNVARVAAGTLVLGSDYSKATTSSALATTDSLNTAFGKIEKSLDDTNARITNLIGEGALNTAFDTLKEVSDWLATNDSGADGIIDDIAVLKGDNTTEGSVAYSITQAIAAEANERNTAIDTKINTLDVSDAPVEGQYVSAVSETDGKISVNREALPTYTLTSGSTNGTVAFNEADVAVTGLKSAAYHEEVYFVSKVQYDLDMSTKDAQINGLNFEAKRLTNEVNALTTLVQQLTDRIAVLENQNNSTEE